MENQINFWYIDKKNYSDIDFKEFKKEFLGDRSSKFVQLYFKNKTILVSGKDFYHRDLLELFLKKFDIEFKTRLNYTKDNIPVEKGEDYELVGAGRIKMFDEETLYFYDNSADYIFKIKGTDSKHLEEFFGSEKVFQDKNNKNLSFFVSI